MAESLPAHENYDPLAFYSNPEDWDAIQGGVPRVFWDPNKPHARWLVLHVYDEHPMAEQRFRSGAIIETMPPNPSNIPMSRLSIKRHDSTYSVLTKQPRRLFSQHVS